MASSARREMAMDDMVADLEKATSEIMGAADAQLPVLAGGGEKELLDPDLGRLLPGQHKLDLKGVDQEGLDTTAHQVPAVFKDEEQEHPILKNLPVHQVEGGAMAGRMNPGLMKWLAYWLLVAAASVILLDNHTNAAPQDQLFPPGLGMFALLLCAICLILRSMVA